MLFRSLDSNIIGLFGPESQPRGEYVLVLQGALEKQTYPEDIKAHVLALMASGMDKKEAVKTAARQRGVSKDSVYKECLEL